MMKKRISTYRKDVIVTDIEMSDMTGVEVLEIAKDFENAPEFIIIIG